MEKHGRKAVWNINFYNKSIFHKHYISFLHCHCGPNAETQIDSLGKRPQCQIRNMVVIQDRLRTKLEDPQKPEEFPKRIDI